MSTAFVAEIELGPQSIDRSRRWNVLRFCLAAVLLTATGLKTYQLATTPSLGDGLLNARWLNILIVEFELGFGVWLIFGMLPKATWLASLACFTVFAGVSFYKGIIGADSCGCFGAVAVNPWYTFTLDACIIAALIACRPNGINCGYLCGLRWDSLLSFGITWLTLSVPAGVAMASFHAGRVSEDGRITGNSSVVILEPTDWIGQTFPLRRYTDIGDDLMRGKWTVVLYGADCLECRAHLRTWSEHGVPEGLPVVLLEMDGNADNALRQEFASQGWRWGRLSREKQWFATTPAIFTLKDGVVTGVRQD